jgi:hypothetical protein
MDRSPRSGAIDTLHWHVAIAMLHKNGVESNEQFVSNQIIEPSRAWRF